MIKRFQLTLGEDAASAGQVDVVNYIGLLRSQNLHPKSLRNHLLAIKIYFRYLVASGTRAEHPCQFLNLKDQINRQVALESLYSREVLEEFYEEYQERSSVFQSRDKVMISLLIYQALRVLEISELRVGEVDLEAGTLRIRSASGSKARVLSLKPKQILLFHSYLENDRERYLQDFSSGRKTDLFLLNGDGLALKKDKINRIINWNRDKENRLRPLKIRQSVIAQLLKENHDIRIVQEFAGHRKTASTEAYKQSGLEELKSSIERLHPLQ